MGKITYREAVRAGLREALQSDPRVFLMGEDVGATGGIFQASKGLWEEFGPERVRAVINLMFERTEDPEVLAWMRGEGYKRAGKLARAALIRSCLKKQPRGVFTVSGNLSRYDDGRRDLRDLLKERLLR